MTMYKESLEKAREILVQCLALEAGINLVDKVELMMNIDRFLNPDKYEDNISILNKEESKNALRYQDKNKVRNL